MVRTALIALITLFALPAFAGTAEDRLDAAVEAHGGARAIVAASRFSVTHSGVVMSRDQARDPEQVISETPRVSQIWVDQRAELMMRDADLTYGGGIRFFNRLLTRADGGAFVDLLRWRAGNDLAVLGAEEAGLERGRLERMLPHLVLLRAQAARDLSIDSEGRLHFTDAGADVRVRLDPETQRVSVIAWTEPGDRAFANRFSAYQQTRVRNGPRFWFPQIVELHTGDRLTERLTLVGFDRLPSGGGLFSIPNGYSPPPPAGTPSAREIAGGVFILENLPGEYNSVAVVNDAEITLIEAPLNDAHATAIATIMQTVAPNARVTNVVVSHHHGDHTGGVGYFAERGATILAPQGSSAALQRRIAAQRPDLQAQIEEISAPRDIGGDVQVRIFPLATSHAAGNLITYIPSARTLYQGDLFYLPARGPIPPAFDITTEFSAWLDAADLDVNLIVSAHGRPGSPADLSESLRLRGISGDT